MRRVVLVAFAILGLTACGKSDQATADVAAPGAAAGARPYTATCLEMAAAQNWSEAARLCSMAIAAEPGNEALKAALEQANDALKSEPEASSAPSPASGEAVGEAADDAAEAAGAPN